MRSNVKIKVLLSSLVWSAPMIMADNQPSREKDMMGILVAKQGPDNLAVYANGGWLRLTAEQWAAAFVEPMPDMVPFKPDTPGWAIITGLTPRAEHTGRAEAMRYDLFSQKDLDLALGRNAHAGLWPWFKTLPEASMSTSTSRDIEQVPGLRGCKPTVRMKQQDHNHRRRVRHRMI